VKPLLLKTSSEPPRLRRAGAFVRRDSPLRAAPTGFFLLSARCSYELVEKTVRSGCPMLVTVSAPTTLAVERAAQAGLMLLMLARRDSVLMVGDQRL
jgi:formate dehydrogenase accessory protein FdhD